MTGRARRGRRAATVRLPAGLALLVLLACNRGVDLRGIDETGDRLRALMGTAGEALGRSDADALRACRAELVRLRLEAHARTVPAAAVALRDTLVAAMDQLSDGLDATASGVDARTQGEGAADIVWGEERLLEAARYMEFGQARLEGALATLRRSQELRAGLEGRR